MSRGANGSSLLISWQLINDSALNKYTVYYYKSNDGPGKIRNQSFPRRYSNGVIGDLDLNSTYILSMSVTFNISGMEYEGQQSESIRFFLSSKN